jgi:hypothetical protein
MKHFTHFSILVFIFVLNSLAACKTVRMSDKTVSQSATASETASRRTFYRTLDSLSRQLNLSADSISIIFSTEFPTAFPSEIEGCPETPSAPQARKRALLASRQRNASRSALATPPTQVPSYLQRTQGPLALKIYGLHLNEYMKEKAIDNADLNDSVNKFTQSENIKSATKQKSAPSPSPHHFLFFIYIVITILIIIYLKRRFSKF